MPERKEYTRKSTRISSERARTTSAMFPSTNGIAVPKPCSTAWDSSTQAMQHGDAVFREESHHHDAEPGSSHGNETGHCCTTLGEVLRCQYGSQYHGDAQDNKGTVHQIVQRRADVTLVPGLAGGIPQVANRIAGHAIWRGPIQCRKQLDGEVLNTSHIKDRT